MKNILVIAVLYLLASCNSEESTESKGNTILKQLTNGVSSSKSWKIETAVLKNTSTSGNIAISSLANVKDDEMVFRGSNNSTNFAANLEWKTRNDIRMNATLEKQALLDYYLSSSSYQLTIQSNGKISTSDPNLQIDVIAENKVSLVYKKAAIELQLNLIPSAPTK